MVSRLSHSATLALLSGFSELSNPEDPVVRIKGVKVTRQQNFRCQFLFQGGLLRITRATNGEELLPRVAAEECIGGVTEDCFLAGGLAW